MIVEQLVSTGRVTEAPARKFLEQLNVLELRDMCEDLGLIRKGKKAEMIDRIENYRQENS